MRVSLTALGIAALGLLAVGCESSARPSAYAETRAAPGTCLEWTGQPVERTCVPRIARADAPLVVEIEERCGACGSTAERCTVSIEGRSITLSLDGKACEPAQGAQCTEACAKSRIRCSIPALSEGKYRIQYADASGRLDYVELVQDPTATTSCTLEDAPKGG